MAKVEIPTPPEIAAKIEDHYRTTLDSFSETARILGYGANLVRRVIRASGLARTRQEQLDIATERRRVQLLGQVSFSPDSMGLKKGGKCKNKHCKMAIVVPIKLTALKSLCPVCWYAARRQRAGNMRPIYWSQ